MPQSRVIVALDYACEADAEKLVRELNPELCNVKVGKELFVAAGPGFVERLVERGFNVFLDLKFHDIPHTVAGACKAAARLGVWMLNVHALGGEAMLRAARESLDGFERRPLLIAVTLLTSFTPAEAQGVGLDPDIGANVLRLAGLARSCRLDGVVCSAREAACLRARFGPDLLLVTPGIRLLESPADDQTRIATPQAAVRDGVDYLVVGRPVTRAPDPRKALLEIKNLVARERHGE
jgi:orotidine-5'-phosphate decarboxylase